MTDEEMAVEYAEKLTVRDFIAKPKEIVAYFAFLAGLKAGRPQWHEYEKEPSEHKEIIARNQQGCTLIANYFDNAWRNVWNGGIVDFDNIVCWAYVKLPRE